LKKVLFITYYFPPSGGPGVQRILRFLNTLPDLGWQPVVLTVENGDYPVLDTSLQAKIPTGVEVCRTYIPEPYRLYRKFTHREAGTAVDLSALSVSDRAHVSFKERVALFLRNWLFIPDARAGWLPFALRAGLRVVKQHKIDLIFSSAPPNTVHLVGYWLRQLTSTPWVADFRDPWFKYLVPERRGLIPRKLDAALGRWVVRHADRLIFVCDGVRREMLQAFPEGFGGRETIITNGYNQADFAGLVAETQTHFTLTYVGSFFSRYDLSALIQALDHLVSTRPDFSEDFRLVFCGTVETSVRERLEASRFSHNLEFLGYQDHKTTLTKMVSSTLLLLYIMDTVEGRNIPTSKLFEYLGARRPILALAPEESDAGRILQKTGAGVLVAPRDRQAIEKTIIGRYLNWQAYGRRLPALEGSEVERFEGAQLAKKLVQVWDGLEQAHGSVARNN